MGITGLARFVKFRGKTPTTESKFSTVVGQKPDALINIELFRKVFLGILSKFSGLFFKKKIYEELLLVLVNIWIRTITFSANIWKTITWVVFIIRIIGLQLHVYFYNSRTQLLRSVNIINSCFLSLRSFLRTDCLSTKAIDRIHTTEGWKQLI